jgi:hypothetical protein
VSVLGLLLVALGIGALFLAGWAFARSVLEEFPAARCDDWELKDYQRWLAKREAAQTKGGEI